jgi:hypothetical protein
LFISSPELVRVDSLLLCFGFLSQGLLPARQWHFMPVPLDELIVLRALQSQSAADCIFAVTVLSV